MKKKHVLIIGFGIDQKRTEAVSINTHKIITLLKKNAVQVSIINIGYPIETFNTGSGFLSALVQRNNILGNLSKYIVEHKVTHVLDEFVLPLSSLVFTTPLIKQHPNVKFVKEIHNDYGFSKKIHPETAIRILSSNRFWFTKVYEAFIIKYTNNVYLSKKRCRPNV